jgi:hypothetical protein
MDAFIEGVRAFRASPATGASLAHRSIGRRSRVPGQRTGSGPTLRWGQAMP